MVAVSNNDQPCKTIHRENNVKLQFIERKRRDRNVAEAKGEKEGLASRNANAQEQ